MKEILKKAQQEKYALGSFNFSTAEALKAIVMAARELGAPAIVSTSEGEADFIGMAEAAALVSAWRHGTKLPIILNLDHGKSLESVKKALVAGYNAVHFDGSALPYEQNLVQTKAVVDWVRDWEKKYGAEIIVEGELGYLRGSSQLHGEALEIKPEDLTDPEQAADFITKTGIDSLAMAIGNAHGVFAVGEEKLNLERLADIRMAVGKDVFLVLHGGSGISADDIKKAITLGIVKINVNTELRLAYKSGLEDELAAKPNEAAPYKLLAESFEEMKKVVIEKIGLFGSGGKI
jgi:fructose-bisphosphate aldolase class II